MVIVIQFRECLLLLALALTMLLASACATTEPIVVTQVVYQTTEATPQVFQVVTPPTPTLPPTETPTPTPTLDVGSTRVADVDGMVMVYVPEGSFMMGSTSEDVFAISIEFPQHEVYLDAYWIDQTEVTNAMFAAFLNEMGNQEEGGASWLEADGEYVRIERVGEVWQAMGHYADHPVVEVTWYGARAYCEWVGRRLPTEAEWEKAARGEDGRIYPWGNDIPNCRLTNYRGCVGNTTEAGMLPEGASPYGALDMAGNVWEWAADWWDGDHYDDSPLENPRGPSDGKNRVWRGGSWISNLEYLRTANRSGNNPDVADPHLGFRCVLNASP